MWWNPDDYGATISISINSFIDLYIKVVYVKYSIYKKYVEADKTYAY